MSAAPKLASAVVAALAWTSLAAASATPTTPARGAVVATSNPLFTWSVPEGETTTDVFISTGRSTAPSGAFPAASIVDSQVFSNGERRWVPTRPLFARAYWWSVRTRTADAKPLYSAPRGFAVRATGRITSLRLTRYTSSHHLFVSLKWRTNAKTSTVTLRVKRGGKQLWTAGLTQQSPAVGSELIGLKSWPRPARIPQGTRLTLTATLRAGSFTHTLSRPFLAP